ncbi:hypothetical protein KM043_017362 [Ampulex compressa]|nr:hypothetical protein KM043_017362 [Ampulex compressa]
MPRLPLHPATGTGIVKRFAKTIRFARYGCTNRPFYHIVVMHTKQKQNSAPIEQVGSYDPIPNMYNEKLISFDFERIQYWLGKGAKMSEPVEQLLGLAGFLPVHPTSYMTAWRNRRAEEEKAAAEKESFAKEETID